MPVEFTDVETIGSAGTLIAAGLETAGHYIQSSMLDELSKLVDGTSWARLFGAFLYILAAITALFTFAVGGNYKFALWFIFGPAIFFQLTMWRVPSKGAEWRFADAKGPESHVDASIDDPDILPAERVPKVSGFFALWNRVSSSFVRSMESSIRLTDVKSHLNFLSKSQRFATLFQLDIDEPALKDFIQLTVMHPKCIPYFSLVQAKYVGSKIVYNEETGDVEIDDETGEVIRIRGSTFIDPEDIQAQIDRVKTATVSRADESYRFIEEAFRAGYFEDTERVLEEQYTCEELYFLGVDALRVGALNSAVATAQKNLPEGVEFEKVFQDMAQKFGPPGTAGEVTVEQAEENVANMANAIAVRMLYSAMKDVRPQFSALSLNRHLRTPEDKEKHYDVSRDLRYLASSYEYVEKGQYLNLMLALPYMQGIVLYFLAITYPFFALAIIMPGRHHTFMHWMALWFWAKSWDFGFAVVMLMDELLYFLLPHGAPMSDELLENPPMAFQLMLQADPTYSVNAYYNILAVLLAAVPLITGVLIKKGTGEVLDAVEQGFLGFAGKVGNAMGAYARSYHGQGLMKDGERAKVQAGRRAFTRTIYDPGIQKLLFGPAGLNALGPNPNPDQYLQKFISKLNSGATSPYARRLVMAKINENVGMAMWNNSLSAVQAERSQLAVLTKWYLHDFTDRAPTDQIVERMAAQRSFPWGGPTTDAARGLFLNGAKGLPSGRWLSNEAVKKRHL